MALLSCSGAIFCIGLFQGVVGTKKCKDSPLTSQDWTQQSFSEVMFSSAPAQVAVAHMCAWTPDHAMGRSINNQNQSKNEWNKMEPTNPNANMFEKLHKSK